MKNIILSLTTFLLIASCTKKDQECNKQDSTVVASAAETQSVQTYLTNNGITGTTQHSSGFFYKITTAGAGAGVVNLCSNITIKYIGKLTNGTIFDQTPGVETRTFSLGGLIIGWQKGIPLIKSGGKITLYLPPSLGYGAQVTGSIPANSILIFEIELVGVS